MYDGLTIVIPGYNEEDIIYKTIEDVSNAIKDLDINYEIIVYDDGSTDNTYEIALKESLKHQNTIVFRNEKNLGVGSAFLYALERSKFSHIALVPGDNAFAYSGLSNFFKCKKDHNFVIAYRSNFEVRKPIRILISKTCTFLMSVVSGKKIKDAHGMFILPVIEARKYKPNATNYSYHMLILGKLLVKLDEYYEVPVKLNPDPDSSSRVLKLNVLFYQVCTIIKLSFWRIKQF